MKIDFVAANQDISVGSYRIWISDFCNTLKGLGVDACIPKKETEWRDDSIIVLSKGNAHKAKDNHKSLKDRIVVAINVAPPSATEERIPLDLVIVGSLEEKLSLLPHYENIVVVNLLEMLYEDTEPKKHAETDEIIIGYHGSHTHVLKLVAWDFAHAIKKLSETKKVKLFFIRLYLHLLAFLFV